MPNLKKDNLAKMVQMLFFNCYLNNIDYSQIMSWYVGYQFQLVYHNPDFRSARKILTIFNTINHSQKMIYPQHRPLLTFNQIVCVPFAHKMETEFLLLLLYYRLIYLVFKHRRTRQ